MTDVPGFVPLGHLHSLARASGVAAVIDAQAVPSIEGTLALLGDGGDGLSGGQRLP